MALYGPGATLFALGSCNTVQQFDLNSLNIAVANVQHPGNLSLPSPLVSADTGNQLAAPPTANTSESESSSVPLGIDVSESGKDHLLSLTPLTGCKTCDLEHEAYKLAGLVSSRSDLLSMPGSSISTRTSARSSTFGNDAHGNIRDFDVHYVSTISAPSKCSSCPRREPSHPRNEAPCSLDDNKVDDLFKFTRERLRDTSYKHVMGANNSRLTNDDLRRQMLKTIFGWNKDVDDLIRDEMSRHPQESVSRILLAKWLGGIDLDILNTNSKKMNVSDWKLLALSNIGHASQKLVHACVQRLLQAGDIHCAVTIMLGMGKHKNAVEVYISHKRYMEALILSCLSAPSVWEHHAAIIRKWGEWAVQYGQQQLAIRYFACTDKESTNHWKPQSTMQLNFQTMTPSIPEILSPPLSNPGLQRGPRRSIVNASTFEPINSIAYQPQKLKLFAVNGGQIPTPGGVTLINTSADSSTLIHTSKNKATIDVPELLNNRRPSTPVSARGPGHLSPISEIPSDLDWDAIKSAGLPIGL